MAQLTLGLPKGSLEAATLELFRKSGWKISGADRSYFPSVDDETLRCVLARPQEMSRYVEEGVLDAGITGKDWTLENESDVHVVSDFIYSKASIRPTRWVVVVPQASSITEIAQLAGKRIATEMVGFTKRYFAERAIAVDVEFSWGATEVKPPVLADAIVEATETGSTLRANRLRILETIMESNTQLIAHQSAMADPWKKTKIENLALLLKAAIEAQGRVGLMLNAKRSDLEQLLGLLPALQRPTVSSLSDPDWVAINTILEEKTARELIPRLKLAGGQGIVEYPLNKIVV